MTAPDNQQERLNDYLAGYVDGEGSFHVAVQRNPQSVHTVRLAARPRVPCQPEPRASLDPRAPAGQTRLRPDPTERTSRWSGQVARLCGTETRRPHGQGHPVLSSPSHPQREAPRVRDLRCHRRSDGEPGAPLGGGIPTATQPRRRHERRREIPKARLVVQNPQRPYAEHGHLPVKIWSDPRGDTGSQAEQKRPGRRAAECRRSEVTDVSVPILRGRRRFEESCP